MRIVHPWCCVHPWCICIAAMRRGVLLSCNRPSHSRSVHPDRPGLLCTHGQRRANAMCCRHCGIDRGAWVVQIVCEGKLPERDGGTGMS